MRTHSETGRIEKAARWLAAQAEAPHPAVPTLKARFSLSATEACEAIARAQDYRSVEMKDAAETQDMDGGGS